MPRTGAKQEPQRLRSTPGKPQKAQNARSAAEVPPWRSDLWRCAGARGWPRAEARRIPPGGPPGCVSSYGLHGLHGLRAPQLDVSGSAGSAGSGLVVLEEGLAGEGRSGKASANGAVAVASGRERVIDYMSHIMFCLRSCKRWNPTSMRKEHLNTPNRRQQPSRLKRLSTSAKPMSTARERLGSLFNSLHTLNTREYGMSDASSLLASVCQRTCHLQSFRQSRRVTQKLLT